VLTADAGPPATAVDGVLDAPPGPGARGPRRWAPPGGADGADGAGNAPADTSFVLTTSGSTGVPKLVPLPHDAVARFVAWAHGVFGLGPGRRVLNYAPLNFDLCLLDVWATLAHGGCVDLVPGDQATQPAYLFELLDTRDVHVIQAVPMFYELLLAAARGAGRRFSAAAHVIVTGDVIRPASLAQLRRLFDRATLYNLYGCTETNDSFLHPVPPGAPLPDPLPLGRPLPGVDALLVAPDGTPVEGAGVGELYVATPFQAHGYLNSPEAGDRFAGHPSGAHARRYFRSGDLVARDADGVLTLSGRTDAHVKVRGQRVNLTEVERVLAAHDQVVEAAVVTTADRLGGTALHAAVRRAAGSRLNSLVLRRHCADHLPSAAIPTSLHIADDPLPRTSTGKVDRTRIRHTQTKVA
ncbi:MAG TPA: AMP-binding protein, partial [Pilimelia sp.]|nr:AMP-binding protein [Pilimelia sp.]